jgi:hypothetical protein
MDDKRKTATKQPEWPFLGDCKTKALLRSLGGGEAFIRREKGKQFYRRNRRTLLETPLK